MIACSRNVTRPEQRLVVPGTTAVPGNGRRGLRVLIAFQPRRPGLPQCSVAVLKGPKRRVVGVGVGFVIAVIVLPSSGGSSSWRHGFGERLEGEILRLERCRAKVETQVDGIGSVEVVRGALENDVEGAGLERRLELAEQRLDEAVGLDVPSGPFAKDGVSGIVLLFAADRRQPESEGCRALLSPFRESLTMSVMCRRRAYTVFGRIVIVILIATGGLNDEGFADSGPCLVRLVVGGVDGRSEIPHAFREA